MVAVGGAGYNLTARFGQEKEGITPRRRRPREQIRAGDSRTFVANRESGCQQISVELVEHGTCPSYTAALHEAGTTRTALTVGDASVCHGSGSYEQCMMVSQLWEWGVGKRSQNSDRYEQ